MPGRMKNPQVAHEIIHERQLSQIKLVKYSLFTKQLHKHITKAVCLPTWRAECWDPLAPLLPGLLSKYQVQPHLSPKRLKPKFAKTTFTDANHRTTCFRISMKTGRTYLGQLAKTLHLHAWKKLKPVKYKHMKMKIPF